MQLVGVGGEPFPEAVALAAETEAEAEAETQIPAVILSLCLLLPSGWASLSFAVT